MSPVKMYYFGPWSEAGHHLRDENAYIVRWELEQKVPWRPGEMDGNLQPHTETCRHLTGYSCNHSQDQGKALVHHKDGWTALAFWDRSVDMRGNCCSVYLAEGTFTFEEMVEMSKERFAFRWNKQLFKVEKLETKWLTQDKR